jgi:DNA-binding NarL/FixJ family response regulator
MDVNLGAGIDGIAATRRILADAPAVRVIGLSMHIDSAVAASMRAAGAEAYLTKGGPCEELIETIRGHGD